MNGVQRSAKLDSSGTLRGEVQEVRVGDRACTERPALLMTTNTRDQIKPIERLLGDSLPTFHIVKASVTNLNDQPFGSNYSFEAPNYSKTSRDLLLVRPRVLGSKAMGFLETREPRKFPIKFPDPILTSSAFAGATLSSLISYVRV